MTDVHALTEDVIDRLKKSLNYNPRKAVTDSKLAVLLRNGRRIPEHTYDKRTPVTEWPAAVTWLNFPAKVPASVVGQMMGPMNVGLHIKEPVWMTVVEVDGNRVGLTYGQYRLVAA